MKIVDLFRQSFNGTNTDVIALGSAVSGYRTGAQAIADGDMVVGDEVPMGVREGSAWELSLYKVDSANQLTRLRVLASSNGGAPTVFPAGAHQIYCAAPAEFLNGVDILSLPVLATVVDGTRFLAISPANEVGLLAASLVKAYAGGTAPPADTTKPTAPTNLASNTVTQTSFNVTFTPGTDNVSVLRSEWSLDGTTWTGIGTANNFSVTGRTAATLHTVRIRTVDTSGNVSDPATLNVTTQSSADTVDPTMPGSITTSNITSSGYTFAYSAGSDNVGIDHYEISIDGGATWQNNGLNLSRTVTGRPASTTDNLRVRAHDAAGRISNVLSATVTTLAAAPQTDYTITPYGGNAINATKSISTFGGSGSQRYATPGSGGTGYSVGLYWDVTNPTPAKVYMGWGLSATEPPPIIAPNKTTQNPNNGMTPMAKVAGNAWAMESYLWDSAAGKTWYPWIQPEDASGVLGKPELLLPGGMTITA